MAVLFLSLLTACGQKEPTEPSGTPGTEEKTPAQDKPSKPEEPEEIDLKGYEFKLADDVTGEATYVFMQEMGDSILSDNWQDHRKAVEKELNCKVTVFQGKASKCISEAAAGVHYTDLINNRIKDIITLWQNGLCYNVRDLDLDFASGKFGSESLLDSLTWKGTTVAVYGQFWGLPSPNMSNTMMYNPRLIAEFGLQDPQELYEKKQWNWIAFENMARDIAADNSEEPANKKYIATLTSYLCFMALESYGVTCYETDSDGRYVSNLDSGASIYALEWLQGLFQKGYIYKKSSLGVVLSRFTEGLDFFLPEYSMQGLAKEGGEIGLNMTEEYRWIYYPIGNLEADVTVGHISGEDLFLSVLYDIDEAKFVPFMNRFFDRTFENDYDWQDSFAAMNIYDDFSRDYYFTMWNNAIFDYSPFYGRDTISSTLLKIVTGDTEPSESSADLVAKSNKFLDRYLNSDKTAVSE